MKNIIIITGHAHYASGMLSSLEMIAGPNEDVIAIDFTDGVDVAKLYNENVEKNKNNNILFVCDLMGGTPFKEAAKLAYDKSNVEVVIGCNIGSLLEIVLAKDNLNLSDLVTKIVSSSLKNTTHFDKQKINNQKEKTTDGI
jgi:PTS system N-acetylgalactosamine-specific IIA component